MLSNLFRRRKRLSGSPTSTKSEFSFGSDASLLILDEHSSAKNLDDEARAIREGTTSHPQTDTIIEERNGRSQRPTVTHHERRVCDSTFKKGCGEPEIDFTTTPRGRRMTPSTSPEDDEVKTTEQRSYENAMVKMWQKSKAPKKLAFPSKYPAYLKEPPRLAYEETSTSMRRKMFNQARIKMMNDEPPKREEKKLTQMQPRINTTVKLRASFIRREPLVSQYFSDHYNKFKKPPFKSNGRNLRYPCYAPRASIRSSLNMSTSTMSTSTTTVEPEVRDVPEEGVTHEESSSLYEGETAEHEEGAVHHEEGVRPDNEGTAGQDQKAEGAMTQHPPEKTAQRSEKGTAQLERATPHPEKGVVHQEKVTQIPGKGEAQPGNVQQPGKGAPRHPNGTPAHGKGVSQPYSAASQHGKKTLRPMSARTGKELHHISAPP